MRRVVQCLSVVCHQMILAKAEIPGARHYNLVEISVMCTEFLQESSDMNSRKVISTTMYYLPRHVVYHA